MANMILVTGGAGFIGSTLIHHLLNDTDISVVNVDKLAYAGSRLNLKSLESHPGYHFEQVDICDGPALAAVFQHYQPCQVMHLAAQSHVDRSIDSPGEFIQSNIVGSYQLLDCALEHFRSQDQAGKENFRFLHVSTDEVYGSLSPQAPTFRENDAYRPNSPYAASKAASDHLAMAWQRTYGLPVLISNCTNNYGPRQFPEKLIPVVILKALHQEPIPVYGRGDNIRDWLHVEDHVRALKLILDKGQIAQRYNVGGHCEVSNLDLVKQICTLLDQLQPLPKGRKYASLITFVSDRPAHDLRYAMNTAKITSELNWQPEFNFETGLQDTVQWYLHNLDWCKEVSGSEAVGERLGLRSQNQ